MTEPTKLKPADVFLNVFKGKKRDTEETYVALTGYLDPALLAKGEKTADGKVYVRGFLNTTKTGKQVVALNLTTPPENKLSSPIVEKIIQNKPKATLIERSVDPFDEAF